MLIYKIFREDEWAAFQASHETQGASIDLQDGFIHFSTALQAAETAAKHFAGVEGLMLLACDGDALGDALKWEVSRNDDLFPHLFDTLKMANVLWAKPLLIANGVHQFPQDIL